jgi:hypothetical protein
MNSGREVICRCGRPTTPSALNPGDRTCQQCGYITRFCKCQYAFGPNLTPPSSARMTQPGNRLLLGVAVVSSMATIFALTLVASPFMALFGLGFPLALSSSFLFYALREARALRVVEPVPVAPAVRR